MGYKVNLFLGAIDNEFICWLCRDVLQDPVMIASCEHVFCVACITNSLTGAKKCPRDGGYVGAQPLRQLKPPPRPFLNMLNGLQRRCQFRAFGCNGVITLGQTKTHEEACHANPTRTKPCAAGCGATLKNSELASHNCVEYLKTQLQQVQIASQVADNARALEAAQMKARAEAADREKIRRLEQANAQLKTNMKTEMEAMKRDLMKSVQESAATAAAAAATSATQQQQARVVSWVAACDGTVPNGALVGGSDGGVKLYVARASHAGRVLPGKLVESRFYKHNCCYFSFGGKEQSNRSYEVLIADPNAVSWVPASGGHVPPNSIPGGSAANGELLYVGRAKHAGNPTVGYVHPSRRIACVSYGGLEHQYPDYEILTKK